MRDSWLSYELHECDWLAPQQQDYPCSLKTNKYQRLMLDHFPALEGSLPPEISLLAFVEGAKGRPRGRESDTE